VPVCGLAYYGAWQLAIWIWLYCIVVFLVQDVVKVLTWRLIIRYNLFNINNNLKNSTAVCDPVPVAATAAHNKPLAKDQPPTDARLRRSRSVERLPLLSSARVMQ